METTRVDAEEPVSLDDFPTPGNLGHAPWLRELAPARPAAVHADPDLTHAAGSRIAALRCIDAPGSLRTDVSADAGSDNGPGVGARVSLWLCDLQHAARALNVLAPLLSASEHERAARFGTAVLRERWMAGRATLRLLLGRRTGIDASRVRLQRGRRGRPQLQDPDGLDFNVSHTGGISVIAIAHGFRIGVDVERRNRRLAADKLARKFLSPREAAAMTGLSEDGRRQRFLRHWTCKEAMSKATGDGLIAPFRRIEIDLASELAVVGGPPPYGPQDWELIDIPASDDLFVTLAIWHGHRPGAEPQSQGPVHSGDVKGQ